MQVDNHDVLNTSSDHQIISDTAQNTTFDIDEISEQLIENMPDVQEHVIMSHYQENEQIEQIQASATDKRGERFDPNIHAVDDNGEPKYTASGYFAKKRGRKSGSSVLADVSGETQKNNEVEVKRAKQRAAGSAAANTLITLGVVIGGDEWRPIFDKNLGIDEKTNLENSFSDYFTAKELDDIPVGVALTIAVCGYVLPRFTMPKTKNRVSSVWGACKKWWINRKLKKHGLETKEIKKEGA